jgi:predicted nucleotidyltransferase
LLKKRFSCTKRYLNADLQLFGEKMNPDSDVRSKVAKEAATLLYFGAAKDYKQAKLKAAKTVGSSFLPSNFEVALELDKIADMLEGPARKERLVRMRKEALQIMAILKEYCPVLIGSVWRGNIRQGSDIDIAVYHDTPDDIIDTLKEKGFKISKTERMTETKAGTPETSFHIYVETKSKQTAELVVRNAEEAKSKRKCEIFGDEIRGLKVEELERLLNENPTEKFMPT